MTPASTLSALTWVPIVWLGQPLIFIPYGVTALSFYLPIRFESCWLYLAGAIMTFITWMIVVAVIVEATSHGKFWQW
jgi:hypothetical protein